MVLLSHHVLRCLTTLIFHHPMRGLGIQLDCQENDYLSSGYTSHCAAAVAWLGISAVGWLRTLLNMKPSVVFVR
eukprot:6461929-Amphidinium_carterae.2